MPMLTRRRVILGSGAACLTAAAIYAGGGSNLLYSLLTEETGARQLTPVEAHEHATAGEILLVDIRRPDEWAATGSPESGVRLDLRRDDFIAELDRLTGGKRDTPIALICARGVRSARMANRLTDAGFTSIIDVPEGMLGSAAGPGWLGRGLPLDRS